MLLALMVSLAVAAPAPAVALAATSDDPRIKVWLNHDDYRRGDKARVNVKVAEDGYLVVLRADGEGRVRVLFPLDPSDDAFIRGGAAIARRSTSMSSRARGSCSPPVRPCRSSSTSSCAAIIGTTGCSMPGSRPTTGKPRCSTSCSA